MEKKDILSSCSNSEEQQMQQIQDKAKESCMVSFRRHHSHLKLLSNNDLKGTRIECGFKRVFVTLFGQDVETFTGTMFLNMDQLEKQLDKEEFPEIGSIAAFKVLETQFQMFIKLRIYLDDKYVVMTRNYFLQYTQLEIPEFYDTLIQHMESTIEEKIDTSKALDASLVDTESSGIESKKQDTSSSSGNDVDANDADIKPVYDEEPMAENVEQSHDTCHLPAILTDNQKPEHSYQSLESENICLKKTIAQFQKDFLKMEAHFVNLELKYQNQALKEGQHGQFSKVKSNEAKVKHDIDVIEIINIKLEHKMAKLVKENETLKRHYKELSDSIKITRVKTIEHTTSLIAQNVEFKAQIQEKGFAIAALKNELRKLTGNSVNTKFAKSSIIGKPVLQSILCFRLLFTLPFSCPCFPVFDGFLVIFHKWICVATPHKKKVASDTTIQKPKSYFKELYENTNKAWKWWIEKKCPSEYKWTQTTPSRPSLKWKPTGTSFNGQKQQRIDLNADALYNAKKENLRVCSSSLGHQCQKTFDRSRSSLGLHGNDAPFLNVQMTSVHISSGLVLHQMTSDHNRSELRIQDHNNEQSSSKLVPKVVP
ncbi:hypothetical protein Tco_0889145 [Tanacetum coccineum]